ncbi:MAG: nuclear transport factor 2 family protein [Pseudomonadota bacterium]
MTTQIENIDTSAESGAVMAGVLSAITGYFDLMYSCDVNRFDHVFHPTAHLHGILDGALTVWSAPIYKEILSSRTAPGTVNALREDEILLLDLVSDHQAMVKVRVRIHDRVFVDHLCLLLIDGAWCITAKTFHLESAGAL